MTYQQPSYPPPAYPQPGPSQPARTPWWKARWVTLVVVGVVALGIGGAIGQGNKPKAKTVAGPTVTATPQPAGTKTLQPTVVRTTVTQQVNKVVATRTRVMTKVYTPPPLDEIGEGTYEVGYDIGAGTYRTDGGSMCYFAILNSTDTNDIEDNNNFSGPTVIKVKKGKFLELEGECTWTRR